MIDLTPRQQAILSLIRETIEETGLPPTRGEICQHFGFRSPNAAEQHLRALESKGVIALVPGTSRGIRLRAQGLALPEFSLPVVGRVAAGQPLLAVEHLEGHYRIDPAIFKPRADYLLRVQGMSMRDAGILDQDLIAVHRYRQAKTGQTVVARINRDEVTVKHYRQHRHYVELLPAHPEFRPIELDLRRDELELEGVVVGVLRRYR